MFIASSHVGISMNVDGLVSVERWSCSRGASCVVEYTMGRLRGQSVVRWSVSVHVFHTTDHLLSIVLHHVHLPGPQIKPCSPLHPLNTHTLLVHHCYTSTLSKHRQAD